MVKAILFDFWGTLVENGVWSPIKQVKDILGIKMPFPEYVVRMERAMMTEKFDSLKEAFQNVCKEFHIKATDDKIDSLIGMWNKSWMLAKPYEDVEKVLTKLKEKYRLILVSNTDCFSIEKVLEKYDLSQYFEKMFLSYKVHLIKTDKNFLKHVLDESSLQINECILVGDSIQSDMMAAKRIGIKGILIDKRDSRDFTPKIKNLGELSSTL